MNETEHWLQAITVDSIVAKTCLNEGFLRLQPCLGESSVARWYSFKPKKHTLGNFWKVLQWKMLVVLMATLSILRPNGIFYTHLVHFVVMWYIFTRFGMLYREKSGNPRRKSLQDDDVIVPMTSSSLFNPLPPTERIFLKVEVKKIVGYRA
jgi:hypothetical protein